jgi:hypothetical protein
MIRDGFEAGESRDWLAFVEQAALGLKLALNRDGGPASGHFA